MNSIDSQRSPWRPLFFELLIAVSLAVAYFYLVRNFFAYGDPMSLNVFTAGSEKLYRLNQPFNMVWNGRLSGLLLAGALTDSSIIANTGDTAQLHHLINVFGLYHSCWLLLLFVCVIFTFRYSLIINFGIFAGLMYNFSPTSGPYFYPWDMPVMFFFTLAVLFFERRNIWMMAVAICAGAFFKETVLVSALLVFFLDQWKWPRRVLLFAALISVYVVGKKCLLVHLNTAASMFSPDNALHLRGSFSPASFVNNVAGDFKALFSPTLNSVIFVNAGTLAAVLVLGWQRRFLPYMIVIAAFVGGLVLFSPVPPGITEIRAFMEVLPLSVIILSVLWIEHVAPAPGIAAANTAVWPSRPTVRLLAPIVIAVIVLSTGIAAFQYCVLYEDLQPANQAQSGLGKYHDNGGKTATLEELSSLFQSGYSDTALKLGINAQLEHRDRDAEAQYEHALEMDTNSLYAMNNLATLLATDSDRQLRDGGRAINLARQACELTGYHEPALIYTLAAAYAEAGRFTDAVAAANQARTLALQRGESDLVTGNEPLVNLYKSGHPFHQQP